MGVNQVENSYQTSEPFLSSILSKKSPTQVRISERTNRFGTLVWVGILIIKKPPPTCLLPGRLSLIGAKVKSYVAQLLY
ncbi:MAG: hypothetical protein WBG58_06035 [Ignavibacteriaceae bacterium]